MRREETRRGEKLGEKREREIGRGTTCTAGSERLPERASPRVGMSSSLNWMGGNMAHRDGFLYVSSRRYVFDCVRRVEGKER